MDVPQNAPESCPGTSSTEAGKASACAGCPNQAVCASAPKSGADPDAEAISERMRRVKHKILVLSGKGGVGKSTVSSQLAFALAAHGKEVGLLDIDICGPSAPKMFGLEGQEVHQSNLGWSPVYVEDNLAVMSIGFMLPDPNEAVIWRGPRKNSLIKQFLKDVNWGELDYLVVDAPPGTSDEHITIAQCLKSEGTSVTAVIVTTPQQVSIIDVRKEVNFCKKVGLSVLGVVENMSGLQQRMPFVRFEAEQPQPPQQQPASGGSAANGGSHGAGGVGGVQRVDVTARVIELLKRELGLADASQLVVCTDVFEVAGGGAEQMCADMAVPFLGRIPLDPAMGQAAERGESVLHARGADGAPVAAAQALCTDALRSIVGKIVEHLSAPGGP